jgi:hypothetical protein
LLVDLGTSTLLYILVITSLLGAILTWAFRIETAGVSLDAVGAETKAGLAEGGDLQPAAPLAWAPADSPAAPRE